MNLLTRVFIVGFMLWCIVGSIFRLFVMTTRSQPYDAVPLITMFLAILGLYILRIDRSTPRE